MRTACTGGRIIPGLWKTPQAARLPARIAAKDPDDTGAIWGPRMRPGSGRGRGVGDRVHLAAAPREFRTNSRATRPRAESRIWAPIGSWALGSPRGPDNGQDLCYFTSRLGNSIGGRGACTSGRISPGFRMTSQSAPGPTAAGGPFPCPPSQGFLGCETTPPTNPRRGLPRWRRVPPGRGNPAKGAGARGRAKSDKNPNLQNLRGIVRPICAPPFAFASGYRASRARAIPPPPGRIRAPDTRQAPEAFSEIPDAGHAPGSRFPKWAAPWPEFPAPGAGRVPNAHFRPSWS